MSEQEIRELSGEIASLNRRVELLDVELAPVTRQEFDIKDQIRRTHGGRPGIDPIQFNWAGAPARRPLFERLTEIAVRFGKVKAKRSELRSLMKAYEKRVEVLRNELERERKREMRRGVKKLPPTKFETLDELLKLFGSGRIDHDRFWRDMNAHGYTQADIDWWFEQDRKKSAGEKRGA